MSKKRRSRGVGSPKAVFFKERRWDGLDSPPGVHLGLTANRLIGCVGMQVSYRRLAESGGEITGYCGAFPCTSGPFDESRFLNTAAVGLTLNTVHTIFVDVNVGFVTSFSLQERELVHVYTGEETRRASVGPDSEVSL